MRLKRRHVLIGSAVLLGFAVAGFAAFALTGGLDRKVVERVEGDGTRTVRVALVDAVVGFDVSPDELVVEPGTHVVLDVVNEGGEVHDLVLDGGARTRHLDPGGSERLDLGVVWGSLPQLYCTLPGHRLAGMTLDVRTEGGPGGERSSALGPGARGEAADG